MADSGNFMIAAGLLIGTQICPVVRSACDVANQSGSVGSTTPAGPDTLHWRLQEGRCCKSSTRAF